jgi:YD repeat-containing protein
MKIYFKIQLLFLLTAHLVTVPCFALSSSYTYDDLHRLMKVQLDDGRSIEYQYDELGNRIRKIITVALAQSYTVTPTAGSGVTLTPNISQTVNSGSTVTFKIFPPYLATTVTGTCGGTLSIGDLNSGDQYVTSPVMTDCTVDVSLMDVIAPTITNFEIPSTVTSLTIAVSAFTATDAGGVIGYLISENNSTPTSSFSGWTSTPPTTFTFSTPGSKTLYAWAKDAAGNISVIASASTTVTLSFAGTCGSSNGAIFNVAPNANLCTTGTPSLVTGSGPWNWTCNGGTNANCSAAYSSTIEKVFGGGADDNGFSIKSVNDGGYIIAGSTASFGSGGTDVYLLRIDALGNKLWEKTFGGTAYDGATDVIQAQNGDFVVTGSTTSFGSARGRAYLVRTDSSGNKIWENTYGGADATGTNQLLQTSDGGFVLFGNSTDQDPWLDYFFIKVDANGNQQWIKYYNRLDDQGRGIAATSDGGFILVGDSGYWEDSSAKDQAWIIKVDASSNKVWDIVWGGSNNDAASGVVVAEDDNIYVVGSTSSYGAGGIDAFLLKLNSTGQVQWYKTYGGANVDYFTKIVQKPNGNLVATGSSEISSGQARAWLVETDLTGNEINNLTFGSTGASYGSSLVCSDTGCVVAGYTNTSGNNDLYVVFSDTTNNTIPTGALSVTKTGSGTGSVVPSSGTISWSSNSGSASYQGGTVLSLVAVPDSGSTFSGWLGACIGTGNCLVTIDADADYAITTLVTATFALAPVNGVCGSTNGQSFSVVPASNLCSVGIASAISGSGPWSWTCAGTNGGTPADCIASIDITGPSLVVSTLKNGAQTNNATLNISGTVTDANEIRSLTINAAAITISSGSFSYPFTLVTGTNTITTVAIDSLGNSTTDIRTITLDQTAPVLIVTIPAGNSTTAQGLANVIGTINETSTVKVIVNNGSPQDASITGNSFSASANLTSGLNTITITATDLAGNTSSIVRTVTYDDTIPSLAITNPNQDITTEQGSLTLSGTVSDSLTSATVSIHFNNLTLTPLVTSGTFSQLLTFPNTGTWPVVATATDEVGNTATATRNIIFAIPANGACGTSNGGTFATAPTTSLCTSGTSSSVTGTGPWYWTCNGTDGGASVNCSADSTTSPQTHFTVTPATGSGYTIIPATPLTINSNDTTAFTVTPVSGYGIAMVSGCGGNFSGTLYTTGAITANCMVSVMAVARNASSNTTLGPTVSDALKVLQAVVGITHLTPAELILYDVAPLGNSGTPVGNGVLDAADVILILRRSIGIGNW